MTFLTFVVLVCGAALQAQPAPPVIGAGGVTEAAQFMQMVAPGSIATIFGKDLAGETLEAGVVPLPLELGGVRVEVNGVAAPLYFVSSVQINFQVPFETALGEASVVVFRDGVASQAEPVQVKAYVPAAFKNASTGEAIVVESGTARLISAENPAVAGQVLTVYMDGYGTLNNTPATGAAASANPLSRTVAVPQVMLGDQNVTVYYAGLTPGLVGLGQLDIGLPAVLPQGYMDTLPLSIDFDGVAAPVEDLPVALVRPAGPDVGMEVTSLTPASALPGGSFQVNYMLRNLSGYSGEADVTFYIELGSTVATLDRFTVELAGVDVALTRELTVGTTLFPGNYTFNGRVEIPGDANSRNDTFVVAEPFVVEAAGGDPHDIGVEVTSVTPLEIAPGDTLTFEYTLLNLTGYSGPVTVTHQLSTSTGGRALLTENVVLDGEERDIVREVPTPEDLPAETYRPLVRVQIDNDTDATNNLHVFFDASIVVSPVAPLNGPAGEAPPFGDLTEGNLSEWELEAYRNGFPVNPGVRLGSGAGAAGSSFLTGVAPSADRLVLRYPRTAALRVNWDLSQRSALEFWARGGANPRVVLRSPAGSRTLTAVGFEDARTTLFERFRVALEGNAEWRAVDQGDFDLSRVTAFELDFQLGQSGEAEVDLDGVQLTQ